MARHKNTTPDEIENEEKTSMTQDTWSEDGTSNSEDDSSEENPAEENTPEENNETTRDVEVQGLSVPFTPRYTAGHVMNNAEAATLNQTLLENIRNGFSRLVAAACKTEGLDTDNGNALPQEAKDSLLEVWLKRSQEYSFGMRAPRIASDPVAAEATRIARASVMAALRKKDREVTKTEFAALVQTALEKNPRIYEIARGIVASRSSMVADLEEI